jgi:hypothetical protein
MGRPIHRSLHMWTLAGQSVPPRPFSRWDARPAKTNFLKVLTLPAPRTLSARLQQFGLDDQNPICANLAHCFGPLTVTWRLK